VPSEHAASVRPTRAGPSRRRSRSSMWTTSPSSRYLPARCDQPGRCPGHQHGSGAGAGRQGQGEGARSLAVRPADSSTTPWRSPDAERTRRLCPPPHPPAPSAGSRSRRPAEWPRASALAGKDLLGFAQRVVDQHVPGGQVCSPEAGRRSDQEAAPCRRRGRTSLPSSRYPTTSGGAGTQWPASTWIAPAGTPPEARSRTRDREIAADLLVRPQARRAARRPHPRRGRTATRRAGRVPCPRSPCAIPGP